MSEYSVSEVYRVIKEECWSLFGLYSVDVGFGGLLDGSGAALESRLVRPKLSGQEFLSMSDVMRPCIGACKDWVLAN